jgi:hypothetical protein
MADQRLGIDTAQFFLANREVNDRHIGRLQPGVGELLGEASWSSAAKAMGTK